MFNVTRLVELFQPFNSDRYDRVNRNELSNRIIRYFPSLMRHTSRQSRATRAVCNYNNGVIKTGRTRMPAGDLAAAIFGGGNGGTQCVHVHGIAVRATRRFRFIFHELRTLLADGAVCSGLKRRIASRSRVELSHTVRIRRCPCTSGVPSSSSPPPPPSSRTHTHTYRQNRRR